MSAKRNLIAVGDIHGMAHTLRLLLDHLQKEFSSSDTHFVFLGDLVDRGPNSLQAVNQVCGIMDRFPGSVLILGNHDYFMKMMALLVIDASEEAKWLSQGGAATLDSYGLDDEDLIEAGKKLRKSRPRHVDLFRDAVPYFETPNHFFTHAGVDPEFPLSKQYEPDLMWIREPFLTHRQPFEKLVVHGHSITESGLPEVHSNRIALDTGSYDTGRISAGIFVDDKLDHFLVAEYSNDKQTVRRFDAEMVEISLVAPTV